MGEVEERGETIDFRNFEVQISMLCKCLRSFSFRWAYVINDLRRRVVGVSRDDPSYVNSMIISRDQTHFI